MRRQLGAPVPVPVPVPIAEKQACLLPAPSARLSQTNVACNGSAK
jgi:hypothetical protein